MTYPDLQDRVYLQTVIINSIHNYSTAYHSIDIEINITINNLLLRRSHSGILRNIFSNGFRSLSKYFSQSKGWKDKSPNSH